MHGTWANPAITSVSKGPNPSISSRNTLSNRATTSDCKLPAEPSDARIMKYYVWPKFVYMYVCELVEYNLIFGWLSALWYSTAAAEMTHLIPSSLKHEIIDYITHIHTYIHIHTHIYTSNDCIAYQSDICSHLRASSRCPRRLGPSTRHSISIRTRHIHTYLVFWGPRSF